MNWEIGIDCCCSIAKSWLTLCNPMDCSMPGFPVLPLVKLSPEVCPSSCLLSSVQFSCSVMSDSLPPHGLQHARPPCPSPTPGVHSNSCPLSRWCHLTHLILCGPLLLPPSIFPSIRVFSNESALVMPSNHLIFCHPLHLLLSLLTLCIK